MEQARKFGAFAGVFTPSLLTILGVIMYMRLGWVVGQAGLISALVIIVLAHVISISTGLSISSIATDKKIQAGGIYYILSRSLGLPIGGSIGIALFVGTALSISLYLVGFAESFLAIETIRNFTGLEQDVTGFRIVGTVAIVILVIIAFISTSVAIKTQFYIMAAIALSLISIFVGLFIHTGMHPEMISLSYLKEGISPEVVFAIFFPAVTGFTAGVAMSGDLKDPKKTIPKGTLWAIGCGFLIYVGLAVSFALFVDRELLLTDYNFLLKVAWFAPLVIAGIWGATLSSAMGGILGGPRILQAISSDRITPRVFSRGYGASNEPRNALLMIFLIAEAGILIGELNVIAGIVTMFYLASYGFINISFFLENWASPDFRPSFRVNRYIGLVGFFAAFGVMFKLDMLSMFAALIIMGGLYFYLRRRKLRSEYGDVWQSVYASLVRNALHRMSKKPMEQRNWQPNIVLFSGGSDKRPHLIEFGKSLVGRHGVLSNFDLIEDKNSSLLFSNTRQEIPVDEGTTGVFTRRTMVRDLYDGIESIAGIYGFSGFEPNTVLMGWGRETRYPARFAGMLHTLYDLDLNVLLLDYDQRTGFGQYQTIDIWWKDVSNQGNLALALEKLLLHSGRWQSARIRLMIVNSMSEHQDHILTGAEELLDTLRIKASVKVIDNHIRQEPFYDIVVAESRSTDLVIMGIPELEKGKEADYVESTSNLLRTIGTVLLIKASSTFKNLSLGLDKHHYTYIPDQPTGDTPPEMETRPSEILLPDDVPVELKAIHASCAELITRFHKEYVHPAFRYNVNMVLALEKQTKESFQVLESGSFRELSRDKQARQLATVKTNHLVLTEKIIEELQKTISTTQREGLEKGIRFLLNGISHTVEETPARVSVRLFPRHLVLTGTDSLRARNFKRITRLIYPAKKIRAGITYTVRFQRLIRKVLPEGFYRNLNDSLTELVQHNLTSIHTIRTLLLATQHYYDLFGQPGIKNGRLEEVKKEVGEAIRKLKELNEEVEKVFSDGLREKLSALFPVLGHILDSGAANLNVPHADEKFIGQIQKTFQVLPERWSRNRILLYNGINLEVRLKLFAFRLGKIIERSLAEIGQLTNQRVIVQAQEMTTQLHQYLDGLKNDPALAFNLQEPDIPWDDRTDFQLTLDRIIDKSFISIKTLVNKLPETSEVLLPDSVNNAPELLTGEVRPVILPTYKLVDYHVQSNLFETLHRIRGTLPPEIYSSASKIRNLLRLVSIGNMSQEATGTLEMVLREDEAPGMYPGWEGFFTFTSEQAVRVEEELNHIHDILRRLKRDLEQQVTSTTGELVVSRLLRTPDIYKEYAKKRESRRRVQLYRKALLNMRQRLHKVTAALWYRQSDAFLFARKISTGDGKQRSVVDSLLTLYERVSPSEEVLNRLPFYYRQLFLQKYNFKSEFWVNRQKEIAQVQQAIARYRKRFQGGILIRGDRNTGKTFFINYISSNLCRGQRIYALNAPSAGSINPEVFIKALRESTGLDGSPDYIFASLEEDSLIVIDDLELWWEKSAGGTAVVELIGELIRKHGHKCLFLLTVSEGSYRIISQLTGIDSCFLSVVDLQPFNALAIREVIMFRHQSSGLEIRRSDRNNIRLTRTAQAKLFARYFIYTRGNIGAALLAWISHITDFRDNMLYIRQPQIPDHAVIDRLSPVTRLYLAQFLFHKRLDQPGLQRLTMDPAEEVEKQLLFLKRAGLINERAGRIFELDRYLYIHLKHIIQ